MSLCISIYQGIVDFIMLPWIRLTENTTPIRICHFILSINNTTIAGIIVKHVWDAPRMLQDTFEKALTLEAG